MVAHVLCLNLKKKKIYLIDNIYAFNTRDVCFMGIWKKYNYSKNNDYNLLVDLLFILKLETLYISNTQ